MSTEPILPKGDGEYHQRLNLNVWDSFLLKEVVPVPNHASELCLFTGRNVGNLSLCNLQAPDVLVAYDHYAVIQNWYARCSSNTDDPVWITWTQATIATLVLGDMPVHQLPLADLLRRKEGQRDEHELADTVQGVTGLARKMFEKHETDVAMVSNRSPSAWSDIHGWAQSTWIATASHARSLLRAPVLAVVPPRQNCDVKISSFYPVPVLDMRIWLHLEGIYGMDVALRKR
jgi:hypothetical protein